jgi:hypothetical protein
VSRFLLGTTGIENCDSKSW